jgi:hypothetical protein
MERIDVLIRILFRVQYWVPNPISKESNFRPLSTFRQLFSSLHVSHNILRSEFKA